MTADQTTDEHFTDDELAFLRYARFGELPARIRPDEQVPLVETGADRFNPELDDPYGHVRTAAG